MTIAFAVSGIDSPEVDGGYLFFSARTDLDFRRTPRILVTGHVASGVPRCPPAPRAFFAVDHHLRSTLSCTLTRDTRRLGAPFSSRPRYWRDATNRFTNGSKNVSLYELTRRSISILLKNKSMDRLKNVLMNRSMNWSINIPMNRLSNISMNRSINNK